MQLTAENENAADHCTNCTLHLAAQHGDLEAVKYYVQNGQNIDSFVYYDKCNCTALALAAKEGHIEVVKYLLDNHAQVDTMVTGKFSFRKDLTSLQAAVSKGQVDVAKLLIAQRADINIQDEDGWTVLFYAAMLRNQDFVLFLMSKGVNVNATSLVGDSVLHVASARNYVNIAKVLIENGADLELENLDGRTPLNVALHMNSPEVADLLLSKGANISSVKGFASNPIFVSPVHYTKNDPTKLMKVLLKHGIWVSDIKTYEEHESNSTLLEGDIEPSSLVMSEASAHYCNLLNMSVLITIISLFVNVQQVGDCWSCQY